MQMLSSWEELPTEQHKRDIAAVRPCYILERILTKFYIVLSTLQVLAQI
jgi:hypothetical protein